MPLPQPNRPEFSWQDYQTWPDDERWELIGGAAYAMSPSPGSVHQQIVLSLGAAFHAFFTGKRCRPYISPLDVKLSEHDVVQPDLLVVCDPNQITPTHIDGAPKLVVEILSPASLQHDRVRKFQLYARLGVQEYWLITPEPALVEIFSNENGKFVLAAGFSGGETLASACFPELHIELKTVFHS